MRVEYIYNSSFLVETENYQILFDYFTGKIQLNENKPCIFVVTHAHSDHYDPFIFDMKRDGDIYLISDDVEIESTEDVYIIKPHEEGQIGDIYFMSAGSTDEGISIYLEVDGHNILHAGDLNLWIWPEDSEEERTQMKKDFEREVNAFSAQEVHIAFFPVDGRLEENYIHGPIHFMDKIQPKILIPMHFREHFDVLKDFSRKSGNPGTRVWIPQAENDFLEI